MQSWLAYTKFQNQIGNRFLARFQYLIGLQLIFAIILAVGFILMAVNLLNPSYWSIEEWIICILFLYNDILSIRILYIYSEIQEEFQNQIKTLTSIYKSLQRLEHSTDVLESHAPILKYKITSKVHKIALAYCHHMTKHLDSQSANLNQSKSDKTKSVIIKSERVQEKQRLL